MDKTKRDVIKEDNERVLGLMRDGKNLSMIPPSKTWFPPRPIIKKDENHLSVIKKRNLFSVVE